MPALVRRQELETGSQTYFERADERRCNLGPPQIDPVSGANALSQVVLHGEKIRNHSRKRLIVRRPCRERRSQPDSRRRFRRTDKPPLNEAVAERPPAKQA